MEVSLVLAEPVIKEFEGLRLKAYHDLAGWPTQGWGHKLSNVRWEDLSKYPEITKTKAQEWLVQDMQEALVSILTLVEIELKSGQVAALVSFVFNLGAENFRTSTMLKKINEDRLDEVPAQLRRWIHSEGRPIDGLKRRREAEVALWLSA